MLAGAFRLYSGAPAVSTTGAAQSMSLLLSITLAASASAVTLPSCSWDRPGRNAFVGDVVAAVDRYADIPAPVRAALKRRMAARQYDEIATIERAAIRGQFKYAPEIRDMHFGQGQVCNSVTRSKWAPDMQERGLVYCEGEHCIIVPTVCRNVARVTRLSERRAAEGGRRDAAQPGLPGMDVILLPAETAQTPLAAEPATASPGASPSFEGLAALPADGSPLASVLAPEGTTAPGAGPVRVASDAAEPVLLAAVTPDAVLPSGGGGSDGPPLSLPALVSGLPSAPSPGGLPGLDSTTGDVPLPAIPEPGPWALWLAGLGVMALLLRRRQ